MKSIKFNDQEIELLRNLYQSELEEAENYIKQIKSFLNKIGVPVQMDKPELEVKTQKKRGPKPKVAKEEAVPEVVKKERKKRTVETKLVKQEEPRVEPIVIPVPVPVRKERKQRIAKVKPAFPMDQEPLIPVKSVLTETAPPQQGQTVSGLDIPVVKEEHKIDVAPPSPPIIPKPVLQSSYPNSQYSKKKEFRPKRPRFELKPLSKPVHVKVELGKRQFGENQDRAN